MTFSSPRTVRCLRTRVAALGLGAAVLGMPAIYGPLAAAQDRGSQGRSSGCGKPAAAGKLGLSTRDGNHRSRTFLIQVPADYDPSRAYALTFVFHGAGGSSSQSYSWGLQNADGAGGTGIFVFPDGIAYQRYGIGWDDTNAGYDLPFFDNMLNVLETGYCIDRGRIFAAGFSWGGDFTIALACNRGDELSAVAANSTDDEFKDTSNHLTYRNLPCATRRHPPVRFEHALGGDESYPAPDFATTSKLFQYLNSCSAASTPAGPGTSTTTCVSYSACSSAYVECTFDHAIGHALPPNWARDTWRFFTEHPR